MNDLLRSSDSILWGAPTINVNIMVQWSITTQLLNVGPPAWKVGDRGFEPHSALQIKWIGLQATFVHIIGYIGPGEPPEDGEMTLPFRHRIRNSSPGGLRPSTLPLGHGGSHHYWVFYEWMGKKHFGFFQTAETGKRTPNSGVKGSGANHYARAPAHSALQV